jgi:hypothetical protein
MSQRKLIKDIWFLRNTKMVLDRFENNLHILAILLTVFRRPKKTKIRLISRPIEDSVKPVAYEENSLFFFNGNSPMKHKNLPFHDVKWYLPALRKKIPSIGVALHRA